MPVDADENAPAQNEPTDVPGPADGQLDELVAAVAELRTEVNRGHARAAAREQVIDRLHTENERLRAGEARLYLRPMLTELLGLRNELLREAANLPEDLTSVEVGELLRSYASSAEHALDLVGVTVIRPAVGDALDPARHRASGTVAADAPEQDATVAKVLADGYVDIALDRALAPASVLVFRWSDPETSTPSEPPAGGDTDVH
jgi:molecular chaperone GrpE (heat shock protein)